MNKYRELLQCISSYANAYVACCLLCRLWRLFCADASVKRLHFGRRDFGSNPTQHSLDSPFPQVSLKCRAPEVSQCVFQSYELMLKNWNTDPAAALCDSPAPPPLMLQPYYTFMQCRIHFLQWCLHAASFRFLMFCFTPPTSTHTHTDSLRALSYDKCHHSKQVLLLFLPGPILLGTDGCMT